MGITMPILTWNPKLRNEETGLISRGTHAEMLCRCFHVLVDLAPDSICPFSSGIKGLQLLYKIDISAHNSRYSECVPLFINCGFNLRWTVQPVWTWDAADLLRNNSSLGGPELVVDGLGEKSLFPKSTSIKLRLSRSLQTGIVMTILIILVFHLCDRFFSHVKVYHSRSV